MSLIELMRKPGYIDPELAELIKDGRPSALVGENTDIFALREALRQKKLAAAAAASPSTDPSIIEQDHRIATRDGKEITVRVYKDKDVSGGPVMMMLHGGGWVLGGLENEAALCKEFCKQVKGGVCVNVDYRLAPDAKFPVPLYDCYDAVLWIASHADLHGGDMEKGFVLAGVSAGANMACTISHLARDDKLSPKLTGIWLSVPSILSPEAVPEKYKSEYKSREENKNGMILDAGSMAFFRKMYQDDPTSPLMSPVIFPSHQGVPPTYFQVNGADPLRDEGLIYEKMLREEAGVPTKIDMYPGLPHGASSWWPKASFSKKQRQDAIDGLKWLLQTRS